MYCMNCVSDYKGTKKEFRWYKEAKKILAQNKGTNGDQKVPEVRGTSDQESPFCSVIKHMYKYSLNNFLRIITILFH